MSRSIDLFFDAPFDLDEAAAQIAKLSGHTFAEVPGAAKRVLHSGDVRAELSEHDFVDDRELWFSRYRYVVATTVPSGVSVNDSPQAALLRAISSALKADRRFASLLVFDLQHVVDRHGPTPGPPSPEEAVG
jgi:hypothetical protein